MSDADVTRVRSTYALPNGSCCSSGRSSRARTWRGWRATARLDDPLPLVVAGAPGWGDAEGTSEGGVRFLGFVPTDLPALYACGDRVRLPEPDEGFGLPVAEAMA